MKHRQRLNYFGMKLTCRAVNNLINVLGRDERPDWTGWKSLTARDVANRISPELLKSQRTCGNKTIQEIFDALVMANARPKWQWPPIKERKFQKWIVVTCPDCGKHLYS